MVSRKPTTTGCGRGMEVARLPLLLAVVVAVAMIGAVAVFEAARPVHSQVQMHTRNRHLVLPLGSEQRGQKGAAQQELQQQLALLEGLQKQMGDLQQQVQELKGTRARVAKEGVQQPVDDEVASAERRDENLDVEDDDEVKDGAATGAANTLPADAAVQNMHMYTLDRAGSQRVVSLSRGGVLVMALGNHYYMDFVRNWVHYIRAANITNYLVGALDNDVAAEMVGLHINTIRLQQGPSEGGIAWGSVKFHRSQRQKLSFLIKLLQLGLQVLVTDVDIVWLRNPIPFINKYPDADLLISSDTLSPTVGNKEELERWPAVGEMFFNVGIVLYRSGSLALLQHWQQALKSQRQEWDQLVLDNMLRSEAKPLPKDPNNYFLAWDATTKTGVLPIAYFASGHVYFVQKLHEKMKIQPYCAHSTFVFSQHVGKRYRLRQALLWQQDPPEYYWPAGGFIMYTPHIPEALLQKSGPATHHSNLANAKGHFQLINFQLKELRTALALATTLNRTLILPDLWCGLENFWAPHTGRLPGSKIPLPYNCPADHVLDLLNGFEAADLPESEYGPYIPWREQSILKNPKLSPKVLKGAVTVDICHQGQPGCHNGTSSVKHVPQDQAFMLQGGMSSDDIKRALGPLEASPLLHFVTVSEAFGNFSQMDYYQRFQRRIALYGYYFCCGESRGDSVDYDMWWDVPHADKKGRVWNGTWEPIN